MSADRASTEARNKLFICHSSGDKERVRNLYHSLTNDGFDPWLDEQNLLPGQDWNLEIRRAIRESAIVLIIMSPSSISKAGYVQKEIRVALDVADEQPEGDIFLIPVRLEPCDVPDRLRHLHRVDLFEERGYEKLITAVSTRVTPASPGANDLYTNEEVAESLKVELASYPDYFPESGKIRDVYWNRSYGYTTVALRNTGRIDFRHVKATLETDKSFAKLIEISSLGSKSKRTYEVNHGTIKMTAGSESTPLQQREERVGGDHSNSGLYIANLIDIHIPYLAAHDHLDLILAAMEYSREDAKQQTTYDSYGALNGRKCEITYARFSGTLGVPVRPGRADTITHRFDVSKGEEPIPHVVMSVEVSPPTPVGSVFTRFNNRVTWTSKPKLPLGPI